MDVGSFVKGAQTLIRAPGERHMRVLSDILEEQVIKGGRKAVMLSTLHTAKVLQRKLPLTKVPLGGLKVLDCMSLAYGSASKSMEGFVYLRTPVTLESMFISIERSIPAKGPVDLLMVDSIDMMVVEFPLRASVDFFRFLQLRMAEKEVTLLVLDRSKSPSSALFSELEGLFDGSVDLSEGGGGK